MHILSLSLNYKQTPVEIRERFTFPDDTLEEALLTLRHSKSILESVILSTCNRTEIYVVVDQLHTGRHFSKTFVCNWFGVERSDLLPFLEIKEDDSAINHLFEVAAGLDSMILGETQILGQVREAFFKAQELGTTGTVFNTLFKQVITLAKKAHAQTDIGQQAVSVSYAAIELGKKIYGSLEEKSVLILGAGKMSELTLKHLHAQGVSQVFVVNRTLSTAEELARTFQGQAFDFSNLGYCLEKVDIVVSSTGAQNYVITKKDIEQVMQKRHGRPIFFIDIAVPRDLDPAIHEVENAYLYDIDDLQGIVQANLADRQKEAEKVKALIVDEIVEFKLWLQTLGVVPLINALRNKGLAIQEEIMQSLQNKCPDLTERELMMIRKHTRSIVNQLIRDPIVRIKELAAEPDAAKSLEMFTNIFALEEELVKEEMAKTEGQMSKTDSSQQAKQSLVESLHEHRELPVHI